MSKEKNDLSVNQELALTTLESGYQEASIMLNDVDKLEELFQKVEQKLKIIPKIGDKLAVAATMASMVKSYIKKEYTQPPVGTIIAVISALAYLVSPVDIIPDTVPGFGHIDDAAIIMTCFKLAESDINEFIVWRRENGLEIYP